MTFLKELRHLDLPIDQAQVWFWSCVLYHAYPCPPLGEAETDRRAKWPSDWQAGVQPSVSLLLP